MNISVGDRSPYFFLIEDECWLLLLHHSTLTGLVRALLIIDLVFTFYYDVLGSKLYSVIAVFAPHDVGQVCLEQRFLLSLVLLVGLWDNRRHHFLLNDAFLVVWWVRSWERKRIGFLVCKFEETPFTALFTVLTWIVWHICCFLITVLVVDFFESICELLIVFEFYKVLRNVIAQIESLLILEFMIDVHGWQIRQEGVAKFLLVLGL